MGIRNRRGFASASFVAALVAVSGASVGVVDTELARDAAASGELSPAAAPVPAASTDTRVYHRSVVIDGVKIFYRESGPKDAPAILLLHGFPSSSSMFRDLIPSLADTYRVIAPDYPGYGQSDMPSPETFEYSFDNLARVIDRFTQEVGLTRFAMYVQDYGAPIGFRIAAAHPERIGGLIIQNGNAYDEGLDNDFWKPIKAYWAEPTEANAAPLRSFLEPDGTRWQYTHGARDASVISPDAWTIDQAGLDRQGNKDIQVRLFLSYGTNPPRYPEWQRYFREHQPPTLIIWGKNDQIFPAAGAEPYKRDIKNIDFNLLDAGHFALEEEGELMSKKIRAFMATRVAR
jgi:pimeloyl-ACP methyl ester carboxylesterase